MIIRALTKAHADFVALSLSNGLMVRYGMRPGLIVEFKFVHHLPVRYKGIIKIKEGNIERRS